MKQFKYPDKKIKRNIYFATTNCEKIYQIKQIFQSVNNINIIPIMVNIEEIQTMDNRDVIEDKMIKSYEFIISNYKDKIDTTNFELICEDTGFSFDNMNGFPGALIRFYHDKVGDEGICKFNGGSKVTNTSIVAYTAGEYIEIFQNSVRGTVPLKPQSNNKLVSYGLDPVFIPDYQSILDSTNNKISLDLNFKRLQNLTYAEIPSVIKNIVSARGKSFNDLKDFLTT